MVKNVKLITVLKLKISENKNYLRFFFLLMYMLLSVFAIETHKNLVRKIRLNVRVRFKIV